MEPEITIILKGNNLIVEIKLEKKLNEVVKINKDGTSIFTRKQLDEFIIKVEKALYQIGDQIIEMHSDIKQ